MENEKEIETGNEVAEEKVDDTPDNSVKEGTGESAAEDNKQTDEVDTSIPEKEEAENEETENEKLETSEPEKDYSKVEDKAEAAEILQTKGFDYAELSKEYNQTGKISDETRAKLAKVGITNEIIDNYIAGQEAKAEVERNEMAECIGGREVFNTVLNWAAKNLSQEEIASINEVRDKNIIRIILKDLKARMEDKEGITPEYTKGDGGKPATDIYRSQAEMFEAISNPKYKKDEAYRLDVQKKIAASREAGIDLGI